MNNKLSVCFLILFLGTIYKCYGQELDFDLQGGLGFYKMTDLKGLTQTNSNGKITSNYPANFYFQPSLTLKASAFSFGFIYSYHTTSARYTDHAGILANTTVNCHVPGIKLGLEPDIEGFIRTSVYCELGRVFTNLTGLHEGNYIGRSFYYEPGIQFNHYLQKFNKIGLSIGYFKEFKRDDFGLKGASGTVIKTYNNYGNGWDGFRLGLSFTIIVSKRKTNPDLKP
jgi:hypothetical protein